MQPAARQNIAKQDTQDGAPTTVLPTLSRENPVTLPQQSSELASAEIAPSSVTKPLTSDSSDLYQSVKKVVGETLSVFKESFGFVYGAAPVLTTCRMAFSAAQPLQMLAFGLLTRTMSEGFKHASSIYDWRIIAPIASVFVLKLGIDIIQSRSQSAEAIQQSKVEARIQEKIRELAPQSLERLNQPEINKDYKLVCWGGIFGLTGASGHIIQGTGTLVSLGIAVGFVAFQAPYAVTGLLALSVLYPVFKVWRLGEAVSSHEQTISSKRTEAHEASWGRTWPHLARLYRLLGIQEKMDTNAESKRAEVTKAESGFTVTKNFYNDIGHTVNAVVSLVTFATFANQVMKGVLAAENAIFLGIVACPIFYSSLEGLTVGILSLVRARPTLDAMKRLEVAKKEECGQQGTTAIDWSDSAASIQFKDLHFAYPQKNRNGRMIPILRDVNLKIEPGTFVAVVGDNGAGKSTLLQLLERSYQPIAGSVAINGCDLSSVADSNLFKGMRVLPQNVQAINTYSFEQFLNWGRDASGLEPDPELLNKIMEKIGASTLFKEEIELEDGTKSMRFPDGMNTIMGASNGGVDLSGGELSILYAVYMIYSKPKIICLDEPEKAISLERQKKLFECLLDIETVLGYRPTIVMVTHTLARAIKADKVLFLDKNSGKVEEYGAHSELVERGGEYASWYERSKPTVTTEEPASKS